MRYKTSLLALLLGLGIYGLGPVVTKFTGSTAHAEGNWVGAPSDSNSDDDDDDGSSGSHGSDDGNSGDDSDNSGDDDADGSDD